MSNFSVFLWQEEVIFDEMVKWDGDDDVQIVLNQQT
jgi:hypothetical protein